MADWGTGTYELTAAQLAPVAEVVADAAEPLAGLKALDLACGTGNAGLLMAGRGAKVTGFDAAPRLLEVAAGRTSEAGFDASWVEGDIGALPFGDDSFEVITSVFGVIFGDPDTSVTEIARVLEPNGRVAITTWADEGILPRIAALSRDAVAEALGQPDQEAQFNWGDEDSLRELFSERGIALQCERKSITFTAGSPEAVNREWREHHPLWIALKEVLGEDGFDRLSEKILEELKTGNESGDGFSYTSTYLLAVGSPV